MMMMMLLARFASLDTHTEFFFSRIITLSSRIQKECARVRSCVKNLAWMVRHKHQQQQATTEQSKQVPAKKNALNPPWPKAR